ncbi:MAG: hypothetical protein HPY68_04685 [Candidatus Atribacteria bacterium]|nr:hypothetical protein [Candidatus Atribacteria bacterium]
MKRLLVLVSSISLVIIFLVSGCTSVTTPTSPYSPAGGDFYVCENLLKGFYVALSNENFPQALSYCKPGGATFKYANNLWELSQDYSLFYTKYDVYNFRDHRYISANIIEMYFDMTTTIMDTYGNSYGTSFYSHELILFEKVGDRWLLM